MAGKRWVSVATGEPIEAKKSTVRQGRFTFVERGRSYTASEAEAIVVKALRAAGIDPATVAPAVAPLDVTPRRPVRKSATQIEAERQRREELERAMQEQLVAKRGERVASSGDRLSRMMARPVSETRASAIFEHDGIETQAPGGAVHRWSDEELAKSERVGYNNVLADPATQPFSKKSRRTSDGISRLGRSPRPRRH